MKHPLQHQRCNHSRTFTGHPWISRAIVLFMVSTFAAAAEKLIEEPDFLGVRNVRASSAFNHFLRGKKSGFEDYIQGKKDGVDQVEKDDDLTVDTRGIGVDRFLRGRKDGSRDERVIRATYAVNDYLRGKRYRGLTNQLLRGKKSMSGMDHFLRGRRAGNFAHFLRGRKSQFDHFLRGRKFDDDNGFDYEYFEDV